MGAGAQRIAEIRKRKAGKNPEALIHVYRAYGLTLGSYNNLKISKKVVQTIQLALELDSDNAIVQRMAGLCKRNLARQTRRYGRYRQARQIRDEAEKHYLRAIELNPNYSDAMISYAALLLGIDNNPQAALEYTSKAMKSIGPSDVWVRYRHGEVLNKLGRYKEAETALRVTLPYFQSEDPEIYIYLNLGIALRNQGRLAEAASFYEKGGDLASNMDQKHSWYIDAYKTLKEASQEKESMRMLKKVYMTGIREMSHYNVHSKILFLYLQDKEPELAWQIGKEMISEAGAISSLSDKWNVWRGAKSLFKKVMKGRKFPQHPTGPVFDIHALRKKGVFIYLQQYEGFQFTEWNDHLKAHLEDTYGVPVKTSKDIRPMVKDSYSRLMDQFRPCPRFLGDLQAIRKKQGDKCIGVIGLVAPAMTSGKLTHYYSGTKCSLASAGSYMNTTPSKAFFFTPFAYEKFQRGVSAQMGILIRTDKEPREMCIAKLCCLGDETNRYFLEQVPCSACRKTLQRSRPDWPVGKFYSKPVQAWPAEPAGPAPKRKILLVILPGYNAVFREKAIVKCLEVSLGVKVDIAPRLRLIKRKDTRTYAQKFRTAKGSSHWNLDWDRFTSGAYAAVIVYGQIYLKTPSGKMRNMVVQKTRDGQSVMIVMVSKRQSPYRLSNGTFLMTYTEKGKKKTIRVPNMAKLFIGVLASVKTKNQCYSIPKVFGCPSTIFYGPGMAQQCGIYLCPEARKNFLEGIVHTQPTPPPWSKSVPASIKYTSEPVDLLAKIDPKKQAVKGDWSGKNSILTATGKGKALVLLGIPQKATVNYELTATFKRTAGNGPIYFQLPVKNKMCQVVIDNSRISSKGKRYFWGGVGLVEGRIAHNNDSRVQGRKIKNDTLHKIRIIVKECDGKLDGTPNARVHVMLDGKKFFSWWGLLKDLTLQRHFRLPSPQQPGLATKNATVEFHSLKYRTFKRLDVPSGSVKTGKP